MKPTLAYLLVMVVVAVTSSLITRASVIGGPVTNPETGHIYYLLDESNWDDAEAQAVQLGGHLVTINSQAEQDWVLQTFGALGGNTNRALWAGLRKSNDGVWSWASGETVRYTNWASGEPTGAAWEDAVEMDAYQRWDPPGQWNDNAHSVTNSDWFGRIITRHGIVEVVPHYDWVKWPVTDGGNDHFYVLTARAFTNWLDAEAEAKELGGHLVSINGAEEQNFIEQAFLSGPTRTNGFWIGLNDIVSEDTFVWSSGEPLTFAHWEEGEPNDRGGNEDVAVINYHYWYGAGQSGKRGSWNDWIVDGGGFGRFFRGIIEAGSVATTFTKITAGSIVSDGGDSIGCAWGDYDNDGNLDLLVSNAADQNECLYRNNGDGTFAKVTTGPLVNSGRTSTTSVWGDYDNDGNLDVFVANFGSQGSFLFHNNGNGSFTGITTGSVVSDGGNSHGCAWADYDNDGNLDLFVANVTEEKNFLFRGNGDGTFVRQTTGSIVTDKLAAAIAGAWGDYDNDGDLDLFVTDQETNCVLYRNEGNGLFTKLTAGVVVNDGKGAGAAWADYDNDGNLDLVTTAGSEAHLYRNNGAGGFTKYVLSSPGSALCSCAWGDYDNDGFVDLFLTDRMGGNNLLYHNNGDGTFSKVTSGSVVNDGGRSWSAAWGDYDNDGFLDLFVANRGDENNFLYRNNGNTNHWLKVKLIGTRSNRSGIGAKVRVKAVVGGNDLWQLREVSGGATLGQNSLDAHFGLGGAPNVETLRIQWPSGIVQEMYDVAANQSLTVTEPPVLQVGKGLTSAGFELILTSRGGFSYDIESSTDLVKWAYLSTFQQVNGAVQVLDGPANLIDRRFYRAVQR